MLTTQAIVIGEVNYRDNDKMLTLFSPEFGRLDALSRGCRKSTAKLLAASQLFVCGEFQFNTTKGKHYLAGCDISHSFYNLREDYNKIFAAQFFLEVTSAFILPEQADKPLFYLLINALFALENNMNSIEYIMLFFLVKCAQEIGIAPNLTACTYCGAEDARVFSIEGGGLICNSCRQLTENRIYMISEDEISEIERIFLNPSKSIREHSHFSASKKFVDFMCEYLQNKTDCHFKTYPVLRKIL